MNLPPLYDESDYEAMRQEKDARIAELEAEVARLIDANLEQAGALTAAERALLAQRAEVADLQLAVKKCVRLTNLVATMEAEVARLKDNHNVIDVRPDGRYLTNVHPVVLNVVEDGYVECELFFTQDGERLTQPAAPTTARLSAAACSSSPTSENQILRLRFSTISARSVPDLQKTPGSGSGPSQP